MAFTASTSRRVIYEDNTSWFHYPIGNTPAKAVVPAGQQLPPDCKVLLLGCGDVRNALTTAAALHTAGCSSAVVHLNDISDAILARNVILLTAASSLDCNDPVDLAFIWGIWFNAQLEQEQRQRLDVLLQQAIAGQLPATITLAGDSDKDNERLRSRLSNMWSSWLHCRKSPQSLAAERKSFMMSSINRRQTAEDAPQRSWEEAANLVSHADLLDQRVMDARQLSADIRNSIAAECKEYFLHGSILGDGLSCKGAAINPTLLTHQCQWRVHDGLCSFDCFPALTQQQLLSGASSSSSSSSSSRGGSRSAKQPASPGMLTRALQRLLAQLLAAYQAAIAATSNSSSMQSTRNGVRFVLHGGDGLELASSAGSSLGDTLFDAIDTSNMGDHVGLLNLLVSVGPRLQPKAHARLTVDAMTWCTSKAKSITEYLCMALGGPPSLLPTLLGLRLCTETRFGRLEPYSWQDRMASRASNIRLLEFAPAVPSAAAALAHTGPVSSNKGKGKGARSAATETADGSSAAGTGQGESEIDLSVPAIILPLRPEGDSKGRTHSKPDLAAALLALQQICCASMSGYYQYDRSGLMLQTPAALARLVANMVLAGRVQLKMQSSAPTASAGKQQADQVDSSSSSSTDGVWEHLGRIPELWPFEPHFQYAWTTAWQQILLARPNLDQKSSLPHESTCGEGIRTDGDHTAGQVEQQQQQQNGQQLQQQQHPVVFTGTMHPLHLHMTPTPFVRLLLISEAAATALEGRGPGLSAMMQRLLPFAYPPADAVCEALQKGKGLPAAAGGRCCGVAVIDQLMIKCDADQPGAGPMQVSFLLPQKHQFDPSTTTVCLVVHQTGILHCKTVKLASFQQRQLSTPVSLLLPAPASAPAVDGPVASSSGSRNSTASISLLEMKETATEYTATLAVSGEQPCSGLSVTPTEMAPARGVVGPLVTHEVTFTVSQPAGTQPFKLRLLHPVNSNTASYKFSRAARTISAQLLKSSDPDWPCDVNTPPIPISSSRCNTTGASRQSDTEAGNDGGVFCRFDVGGDLDEVSQDPPEWGMWTGDMFDHAELAQQLLNGVGDLGDPFSDLRETIKIIFVRTVKDKLFIHRIIDKEEPQDSEASVAMYMRVHPPLRRLPNGRPMAVLSVADNVMGLKLLAEGKIALMREVTRFQELMMREAHVSSTTVCSKAELKLLRALLTRNSRRMKPTKWQAKNLPLAATYTHWMATFITPVYPEVLGDSSTFFDAIPHIKEDGQGSGHQRRQAGKAAAMVQKGTPPSLSSPSSAPPVAAAAANYDRSTRPPAAAGAQQPQQQSVRSTTAATATAAGAQQSCTVCGVVRGDDQGQVMKLLKCSRCKNPADRYCSTACQRMDWPRHKKSCQV